MKNHFKPILLIASAALLASCGGMTPRSSSESSGSSASSVSSSESSISSSSSEESSASKTEESSSSSSSSASSSEEIYSIDESSYEEVTDGSCSGQLVDINMNFFVGDNGVYDCRFVSKNLQDPSITIKSSRPQSVTIEMVENSNSDFKLITHDVGDSLLSIYDCDDMLVYRHVVRVRKAYSAEEMPKALYDFDTYVGIYDNHQMAFLDYEPCYGLFTGSDDVEKNMRIEFEARYDHFDEIFGMYYYAIDIIEANQGSQTKITHFIVSPCGDEIVLYYDIGGGEEALLNAFYPKSLAYLHAV